MEKIYLITTIVFAISTSILMVKNYLIDQQYNYLKNDYESLQERLLYKQERLRNYTLTAIELNNICDKFPSSRKEKAKNEKLQELLNELN